MAEEKKKKQKISMATSAAAAHAEDELAALKRKLEKAEAELEEWSALLKKAILEKAPDEEIKVLLTQQEHWTKERDLILKQITELRRERTGEERTVKRPRFLNDTASSREERFLAGLAKARLDGQRLVFKEEVFDSGDKIMYVRPSYSQLFSRITPLLISGRKCVVTGTPGIGKSMYGYFTVHRLLDRGITVIYIYQGWSSCHLYLPKKPNRRVLEALARFDISLPETMDAEGWLGRFISIGPLGLSDESKALYDALVDLQEDTVVIVDPPRMWGADIFKNPGCGLLVVTSPTPERTTAVKSQGDALTWCMPIWTSSELRDLLRARKNGEDLTEEEELHLNLRILRFGGIPRYVAKVNLSHWEMLQVGDQETVDAIRRLTGPEMYQIVNPMSATPHISGRIIHMEVNDEFEYVRKKFASEMIERQILVHFHRSERQAWTLFAECVRDVAGFSSMVGTRSEVWWHSALQVGGDYILEQLFNKTTRYNKSYRKGPARKITFPESAPRYSVRQNLSDVSNLWDLDAGSTHLGLYFHFLKGNVPAIDSIWVLHGRVAQKIFDPEATDAPPPVYVCGTQMTLSDKHSLNEDGVDTFMQLVRNVAPPGAKAELVFITDASLEKDLHYVMVKKYPTLRQWLMKVPAERIFA